jgi:hypothetical protein
LNLYDPSKVYAVERRFNDFKSLDQHFRSKPDYKGFALPPLPPESDSWSGWAFGPSHQFIEQRKNSLEKYLQVIATHANLREDFELFRFLSETDLRS